jgi:hypothetical protein
MHMSEPPDKRPSVDDVFSAIFTGCCKAALILLGLCAVVWLGKLLKGMIFP